MKTTIMEANRKFMDAYAEGAKNMGDMYTSDATIYPPGSQLISGKSTIGSFWQAVYESGVKRAKLETDEANQAGSQVIEVGNYTLYGDNDAQLDTGKYMVIWQQEDGAWKLHQDIWNTSVSA